MAAILRNSCHFADNVCNRISIEKNLFCKVLLEVSLKFVPDDHYATELK